MWDRDFMGWFNTPHNEMFFRLTFNFALEQQDWMAPWGLDIDAMHVWGESLMVKGEHDANDHRYRIWSKHDFKIEWQRIRFDF